MITMRFRGQIFLANPQDGQAGEPPAGAVGQPSLLSAGTYDEVAPADSIVITSLSKAVSAIQSVSSRIQRSLLTNVRFQIYGKPVGEAENPDYDLPAEMREERTYIQGDTPNPALLVAIARANYKPREAGAGGNGIKYVPVDVIPEVNQL